MRATSLVLVSILVLLSGCAPNAGSPVGDASSPAGNEVTSSTTPIGSAPASQGNTPDDTGSVWAMSVTAAPSDFPLVGYWEKVKLAAEYESSLQDKGKGRAWWEAKEASIADCMKQKGFRYYPRNIPSSDETSEVATVAAVRERDNLQFPFLASNRDAVAKHGYGLMSAANKRLPNLAGKDEKNQEYVASLSVTQAEQYELAMVGSPQESYAQLPTTGCMWEAERKHPDPTLNSFENSVSMQFYDVIQDMRSFGSDDPPIEADKRLIALNNEWRACVAKAGVPIEKLRAGSTEPGIYDGPQGTYALAIKTGADGKAELKQLVPSREDQQSLIGSEPEIAIALSDFDCRLATNYVERFLQVQRDLEEKFVASHKKALDEMAAYVDQLVR